MKPVMNSAATLIILALLHGSSKALGKVVSGTDISEILISFTGTIFIGTAVTWAVVWIVLRLLQKQELTITVTNWILAAATITSFALAIMRI